MTRYDNQNYFRNGSCNGVALNPATGTSGYAACVPLIDPPYAESPANAPQLPGNLATGRANELAAYANDTVELTPQWKLVGGLRYDRYQAAIGNSINARQHGRQHGAALGRPDRPLHERARRRHLAADRRAVLLRVVQHLVQSVARAAGDRRRA